MEGAYARHDTQVPAAMAVQTIVVDPDVKSCGRAAGPGVPLQH